MLSALPAFGGVPGGPELVILLLVLVLLFGVPVVVIAGAVLFFGLRDDDGAADADRVAELEAEVDRLREMVDDGGDERDADGDER
jgi:sec-independent protein translocase protein TatA